MFWNFLQRLRRHPVAKVSVIRVMPGIETERAADFSPTLDDLERAIQAVKGHVGPGHVPEAHVIRLALKTLGRPLFLDLTATQERRLHVALTDK